jgi:hypothetical protein
VTVKVRVTFTVDVDAESWENQFGVSGAALREDVKYYTHRLAVESLDAQDLILTREI